MWKLLVNYPRILPVAFSVLFLLLSVHYSQGRRMCYSCSAYSGSENSTDCIDNPQNMTEAGSRVRCKHSCIVKRVEYIYHIPVIFAITRFCDKPNVTNEVTMNDFYITYFRSCKSNLCNDGDGLETIRCFACSAVDSDDPCVTDPTQVTNPDLECAQEDGSDGWCHIQREEFTDIPGKITSFVRLCIKTKEPYPYDDVLTAVDKTTYYRTCRTNRCNSGSGIDESSSGGAGTNLTGIIRVRSESFATSTFANFPLVSILTIAMTCMLAPSF